jgi:hypothetical protein
LKGRIAVEDLSQETQINITTDNKNQEKKAPAALGRKHQ